MSSAECFLEELTTKRMLEFVASTCAECYCDFKVGVSAFYDTESCRYLCSSCAEKLCEDRNSTTDADTDGIYIQGGDLQTLF